LLQGMLEQFTWHNPGVLSLDVDEGGQLVSTIEAGLYESLKAHPILAVGTVRAPYLAYSYSASHEVLPLWYLMSEGKRVAVVSWHRRGAGVIVRFLGSRGLSMVDRIGMIVDWVPRRLQRTRFAGQVTGREGEWLLVAVALATIVPLISGAFLILKNRARHRA
jgi:hypothetical protein